MPCQRRRDSRGCLPYGMSSRSEPVQDHLARPGRQGGPGDVHGAPVGPKHLVQHLQGHLGVHQVAVGGAHPQGALPQGPGRIGHQQVQVQAVLHPQAPAPGAGAFGAVEGEQAPPGPRPAGRTLAQTAVEQAQEIPHFGEGAHGGAGVAQGHPLAHRHGGPQALDGGHRRAGQGARELAGEGRQGLQEPALALTEQGIEGQRGLARARHTGDHGQAAPGDGQVEALEVVLPGPAQGQQGRAVTHGCSRAPAPGTPCPRFRVPAAGSRFRGRRSPRRGRWRRRRRNRCRSRDR